MNLNELQAALAKLEDLAARDKRFEDLLLQLSTALADMHEHQVQQAPAILAGFIDAVRGLKVEPNITVQVNPTPVEFKPTIQLPGARGGTLRIVFNENRMGRIESADIVRIPEGE